MKTEHRVSSQGCLYLDTAFSEPDLFFNHSFFHSLIICNTYEKKIHIKLVASQETSFKHADNIKLSTTLTWFKYVGSILRYGDNDAPLLTEIF